MSKDDLITKEILRNKRLMAQLIEKEKQHLRLMKKYFIREDYQFSEAELKIIETRKEVI